jgi:hypothetical protein
MYILARRNSRILSLEQNHHACKPSLPVAKLKLLFKASQVCLSQKEFPLMIGQMSSDADQGIKNLIGGANSGDSKKTGTEELQAIQGA